MMENKYEGRSGSWRYWKGENTIGGGERADQLEKMMFLEILWVLSQNSYEGWKESGLGSIRRVDPREKAVKDKVRGTRSEPEAAFLPVESSPFKYLQSSHKLPSSFACRKELHIVLPKTHQLTAHYDWSRMEQEMSTSLLDSFHSTWASHHHTDRPSGKVIGGHGLGLLHLMWWVQNAVMTPPSWGDVQWCPLVNTLNLWFSPHLFLFNQI